MGRTKLTQKRLGELLGISQSRVAQLHARGMPTQTVDAARAWREANLDPVQSFAQGAAHARAIPAVALPDPGEIVADALDAAALEIVARLVAENLTPDAEAGSLALSSIAGALADALDRSGADGDPVADVTGPLAGLEGGPRAAVLAQIEARIAAIRAEIDGDA